jgi:hypothetical protein
MVCPPATSEAGAKFSCLDTAAIYLAGVQNCTDSVHKFSRAFLLCYESVRLLIKWQRYHPIGEDLLGE